MRVWERERGTKKKKKQYNCKRKKGWERTAFNTEGVE